jgi:hypothetical protein
MSTKADLAELKDQLATVTQTLTALVELVQEPAPESFTIKEFCARHHLSESQFFKLQREGRAPTTMSVGSIGKRISRDAERTWIADREQEGEAAAVGALPKQKDASGAAKGACLKTKAAARSRKPRRRNFFSANAN